jgi:hypothetical protein
MSKRKFAVNIDLGNAAFEGDSLGPELARVLRNLADRLERDSAATIASKCAYGGYALRDSNGNTVGGAK